MLAPDLPIPDPPPQQSPPAQLLRDLLQDAKTMADVHATGHIREQLPESRWRWANHAALVLATLAEFVSRHLETEWRSEFRSRITDRNRRWTAFGLEPFRASGYQGGPLPPEVSLPAYGADSGLPPSQSDSQAAR